MNESKPAKPTIPVGKLERWQRVADLIAGLIEVPAGLIMRVDPPEIEVFVSSATPGNPYEAGERARLNTGLYCETVMVNRKPLVVPDALKDPEWKDNPDIELGMVSYLGFPLLWPDGVVFGTVCVLDSKANAYSGRHQTLLQEIAGLIEADLQDLMQRYQLEKALTEVRTLRGLLPICMYCKKIRDDKNFWEQVDVYVEKHSEARFSHGLCPDCLRKHHPDVADQVP
ncbi:MAG: GAF domain-containing protein [Phycisphaerae bacterium]|nr:GAF domain-containing protein [Phycisphaerae bacterium]